MQNCFREQERMGIEWIYMLPDICLNIKYCRIGFMKKRRSEQCIAIRRRSYMFYSVLSKLDVYLYPLIEQMKQIIKEEGIDYAAYSSQSKKTIAAVVSTVGSIKAVLDTTILSENGDLTQESEDLIHKFIEN